MRLFIRILVVTLLWSQTSFLWAQQYAPGQLFVIVRPEAVPTLPVQHDWGQTTAVQAAEPFALLTPLAEAFGFTRWEKYCTRGTEAVHPLLGRVWKLRYRPGTDSLRLRKALEQVAWVDTTEMNPLFQYADVYAPNEFDAPLAAINLYWVDMVNARQAWSLFRPADRNVVIAIVDDGVRITHEDLADHIWINEGEIPGNGIDDDDNGYIDDYRGYDVADGDDDPIPPAGFDHGTHVAGIAGAVTDNHKGVVSMAYNVTLMPVKGAPDAGGGILGVDGVRYAVANRADIVNMSWGVVGNNLVLNAYISNAITNYGTLFVAGAGNNAREENFNPASFFKVIAVGSVEFNYAVSGFSNYGAYVDIMAPGNPIYSCGNNSDIHYLAMGGTSMATPMISSALALMKAYKPEATREQLIDCLYHSARDIEADNDPKYIGKVGYGCVNLEAALACLDATFWPASRNAALAPAAVYVYPNPGVHTLGLRADAALRSQPVVVEITDLAGKHVLHHAYIARLADEILPVSHLAPGTYLVRVSCAGTSHTRRWVKQ
ncbi:MAG: S8 family peptidase [Bacteroidetes bacterium]|nr:S8 family peptidase [Bacteroidota bacterium]